jgi:hypothetical protein
LGWQIWLKGWPELIAGMALVGVTYLVVMAVVGGKKVWAEVKNLKK